MMLLSLIGQRGMKMARNNLDKFGGSYDKA